MTNYEKFKSLLNTYAQNYSKNIETDLAASSINNADSSYPVFVYENKNPLKTIDMDCFAREVYTQMNFDDFKGHKTDYACSSVDSFLIDKDGKWYFIEFKDQKINTTKDGVLKKAYQNYIFYDAYVYTPIEFESEFVRNFSY